MTNLTVFILKIKTIKTCVKRVQVIHVGGFLACFHQNWWPAFVVSDHCVYSIPCAAAVMDFEFSMHSLYFFLFSFIVLSICFWISFYFVNIMLYISTPFFFDKKFQFFIYPRLLISIYFYSLFILIWLFTEVAIRCNMIM